MNRIAQLGIRFVILGLLATVIWISKDAVIQYALVNQAERIVGAKIELDHLRLNSEDGRVFVKNIKIADPALPMQNLIQADLAYLRFNLNDLLNRRFVIEEGQIKGLIFNAPRTESGALSPRYKQPLDPTLVKALDSESDTVSRSPLGKLFSDRIQTENGSNGQSVTLSQQWLNQVSPLGSNESKGQPKATQTRQIAEQIQPQWDSVLIQAAQYAESLPNQLSELKKRVQQPAFPNQLRDGQTFSQFNEELAMLRLSIETSQKNLVQYVDNLEIDRKKITNAVAADTRQLTAAIIRSPFDENLVSQILFYDHHHEMATEFVELMQWMRQQIGDPDTPPFSRCFHPLPSGTEFSLTRTERQPQIEIKQLDFEGIGHFGGQHHKFVGTAHNLTSNPHRSSKPMEFHVRALGKKNISFQCKLDRSQGESVDQLEVNWPDFPFLKSQIGDPSSILLGLGNDHQLAAKINIQLHNDRIEGTIEFRHNQVALWIEQLSTQIADTETRNLINQNLATISRFQSSATLSGNLNEVQLSVVSDLGSQLTDAADRVFVDFVKQQNERELKYAQQTAAALNLRIDQEIKPRISAILKNLEHQSAAVSAIITEIRQADDSVWSKLR